MFQLCSLGLVGAFLVSVDGSISQCRFWKLASSMCLCQCGGPWSHWTWRLPLWGMRPIQYYTMMLIKCNRKVYFKAHLYLTTSITASCSALASSLSSLCWHGQREVENSASLIKQLWVQTPTWETIFQIWHFNWAISASPVALTSEGFAKNSCSKKFNII